MRYAAVDLALKDRWPGVDPSPVVAVLSEAATSDPGIEVLAHEAGALDGPQAASLLMQPVAATLEQRALADRFQVFHAIDALIRAGGDPSPVLGIVASGLSVPRTTVVAAQTLRRAALRGWSLVPVAELVLGCTSSSAVDPVAQVRRLVTLQQRGEHGVVELLGQVYGAQAYGNLFGAFAVLEDQLIEATEAAKDTLVALHAAGSDPLACWLTLLPTFEHQLRGGPPAIQRQTAEAVGQLHHAGRDLHARTRTELAPRSGPLIAALTGLLSGPNEVAVAAAGALRVLADHGCDLAGVRRALEAGMDHARVDVRSGCSRALSTWLRLGGLEAPLPPRCSHRRVFAIGDEALADHGSVACPCCKGTARTIYHHQDRSQTHEDTMIEALCTGCGVYSEHHWGY